MTILETAVNRAAGDVVDSRHAKRPTAIGINGRVVSLAPLDAEAHAGPLYEQTYGAGCEELWRYMSEGPFPQLCRRSQSIRPTRQAW